MDLPSVVGTFNILRIVMYNMILNLKASRLMRSLVIVASMIAMITPSTVRAQVYDNTATDTEIVDTPPAVGIQAVGEVVNGGFEDGSLSGWGVVGNNFGQWYAYSGTSSPLTGRAIAAPPEGLYAATTDQVGAGVRILYQDITVPATGTYYLEFQLYYKNFAAGFFTPASLVAFGGFPNQQYRVDLISPGAPIRSVDPSDVLLNIFQTQVGDPNQIGPTPYSVSLAAFAGQTVRLRFAEVDNVLFFLASVDDVKLVLNEPPTADAGGPYLVGVNNSVTFDASASSDPEGDPLSYLWTADGGNLDDATLADPLYTAGSVPGIYDVSLTVNDGRADSDPATTTVVVYDPTGGFVTGGGWIDSPAGAYTPDNPDDEDLTGKANFGFLSKYKQGATVPTGQTQFNFQAGDLNFHSNVYEWLVVNQNGTNAQFKGTGTVNGTGNYGFMLWAGDSGSSGDTFRIKIWNIGDNNTVVYDNGFDQEIGGGQIIVHTSNN
ncbi:MAG: PKD domain-containing protein [Gammaproteobacteria bacterium]